MAPGEIERLFAAQGRQLEKILDEMRAIRSEHQQAFSALDMRFMPRAEVAGEFRLLNERQSHYEQQQDVVTASLEGDVNRLSNEVVSIEQRRQALEERTEERRRQMKAMAVGQFVWPLLVVIAGAILLSYLHL